MALKEIDLSRMSFDILFGWYTDNRLVGFTFEFSCTRLVQ